MTRTFIIEHSRVGAGGDDVKREQIAWFGSNHEPEVQPEDLQCFAADLRSRKPRDLGSRYGLARAVFVIIGLRRNPPAWRYRLGVRTEDSQSSNPGSIPGSATNYVSITYAIS